MKNVITVFAALTLLASLNVHAAAPGEQSPQEMFTMFCGSAKDLSAIAEAQGQVVSKNDLAEINQSRKPIIAVLKAGNEGIQKILEQGDKQDTGAFGAIMTCGVIVKMKKQIKTHGCTDLVTGKVTKDTGGIDACEQVMKRLKR